MSLEAEIREQPDVIARLLVEGSESVRAAARRFGVAGIHGVTIAARGTSDHAALYGQYILGIRNRLLVTLATPSMASIYGGGPRLHSAGVIGISQSGASPDVVAVVKSAAQARLATLAITNSPESSLARVADSAIDLRAGPERSVAATKTYTAELLALAMLSVALDGRDPAADRSLRRLAGQMGAALDRAADAERAARSTADLLGGADRVVVLGRGLEYPTAREWALKLKEVVGLHAEAYSAADFAHGPLTLTRPGDVVLVVVGTGPTMVGLREVVARLIGLGARVVVLSDDDVTRRLGTVAFDVPSAVPEWLRPIVSIVPAQWFALTLARALGRDPERPAHIDKVTLTL